ILLHTLQVVLICRAVVVKIEHARLAPKAVNAHEVLAIDDFVQIAIAVTFRLRVQNLLYTPTSVGAASLNEQFLACPPVSGKCAFCVPYLPSGTAPASRMMRKSAAAHGRALKEALSQDFERRT